FLVTKKLKIVSIIILASLILRLILRHNGLVNDPWSYRFFPTELLFFLLGTVAYHMYTKLKSMQLNPLYLKIIFGGILVVTFFFNFIFVPANFYFLKHPLYLVIFFICLPFVFLLSKKWKRDSKIGDLSYPIYISHLFLLTCIKDLNIFPNKYLGLALTVATVVFSILLNSSVTNKIERIRQKRLVHKL
ncbi:MAG TPA: acyltransferase family protein, partial [Ferruginibacter sp.]|nr:acyltransferase family protein [Ferruginibacter sp.]